MKEVEYHAPGLGREYRYSSDNQSLRATSTNLTLNLKLASGATEALTLTMRMLGYRGTEAYDRVFKLAAVMQLMVGSAQMIRAVTMVMHHLQKAETSRAAALVAARAAQGPSGWATIAAASVASGMVVGAFMGHFAAIDRQRVDMSDKYEREQEGRQLRRVFWS